MSDDSFEEDDDFLKEAIAKTGTVNRQITESIVRHVRPIQHTLTGGRLEPEDGLPARYEEVIQNVGFLPTHHELNEENLDRYVYPSNFEVRDYQFDIIHKALFKNLLCAIPTGMGKTFIASTVMLNYYRWFTRGKIIFMAPTRPLVAQQIQACLGVTDIPSSDTAILLDKSRKNRPEIWANKRVFFTTPQVVENDLKLGTLNPKDIVCLILDEAHRARGNYAYTNVVQFIDRFNTSFRVLALTATPASDIEGVQEVVSNLHISKIEIRTEESIDIVKYMKRKDTNRIQCDANSEMVDIIELLGEAIQPALRDANSANIYEITDPSKINAYMVMQKSRAIITNPSIPEGLKWSYYFTLQVIGYVGQMLRRLNFYGVRAFYSYYQSKCSEFQSKMKMNKTTNKTAITFFKHDALRRIDQLCKKLVNDKSYLSHPKMEFMVRELTEFFEGNKDSRVIVFTELRESALEIVKTIDHNIGHICKPHIFIGQAKGKEGFDQDEYELKHSKKGRGKTKRKEREELERDISEQKQTEKQNAAIQRSTSRTGTSEEAQIQGMNQKTQKEVIKKFKRGGINVLVATSIGEEGLDIGEVDLIICYDSTTSPIKNIQRMGRTGRRRDGKVILLLSGNEGLKFDQAMEGYATVQKQIAGNVLDWKKSDRIIPPEVHPQCIKQTIDIPEDNLMIAGGEDEDEVIKYATQAMLGNAFKGKKKKAAKATKTLTKGKLDPLKPKVSKRFFMPENVKIGFISSSKLVRKIGGDSSANSTKTSNISLLSDDEDGITTNHDLSFTHSGSLSAYPSEKNTLIKPLFSLERTTEPDIGTTDILDNEEIQILDQNSSSPKRSFTSSSSSKATQNRKSVEPIVSPYKQRKVESAESNKFNSADKVIIDSNCKKTKGVSQLINEDDNDSLDDILAVDDRKNDWIQTANSPQIDMTTFISDQTLDDGLDDSLDEILEQARLENETKQPTQMKDSHNVLDFGLFDDDEVSTELEMCEDDFNAPLEPADKVIEKEFEKDASLVCSSSKPGKARGNKILSIPTDLAVSKVDITNLLKDNCRTRKLAIMKGKAVDLIRPSQIIDLDTQPHESEQLHKQKKDNVVRKIRLSQKDTIYAHNFSGDDGFLSEREYNEFLTAIYVAGSFGIVPDPTVSAKSEASGFISSSSTTKSFKKFIRMCDSQSSRRLNRLISELKRNAEYREYGSSVVVYDNNPGSVSPTKQIKAEIKLDDSTQERSMGFLSESDEEFMNL